MAAKTLFGSRINLGLFSGLTQGIQDPAAANAITQVINALMNMVIQLEEEVGITEKDPTYWQTATPKDTIKKENGGRIYVMAQDTIAYGDLVNLYNSAGTMYARRASYAIATPRPAHGYLTSINGTGVTAGNRCEVIIGQGLVKVAPGAVNPGQQVYLGLLGAYTLTQRTAVGEVDQSVGYGVGNDYIYIDINPNYSKVNAAVTTIGGFDIGPDYIRDTGNNFGLVSTITGSNDVRFWSGDTYANRASAPARIYENGDVYFGAGTFAGNINTGGYVKATGGVAGASSTASIVGNPGAANVSGGDFYATGTGRGVFAVSAGAGEAGRFYAASGTGSAISATGNSSTSAITITASGAGAQTALYTTGTVTCGQITSTASGIPPLVTSSSYYVANLFAQYANDAYVLRSPDFSQYIYPDNTQNGTTNGVSTPYWIKVNVTGGGVAYLYANIAP